MEFLDLAGLTAFYNKLKTKFILSINNKTPSNNGNVNLEPGDIGAIALNGSSTTTIILDLNSFWTGIGTFTDRSLGITFLVIAAGKPGENCIQIRTYDATWEYRTYNGSWSNWQAVNNEIFITSTSQISDGIITGDKLSSTVLPENVGIKYGTAATSSAIAEEIEPGQIYLSYQA